MGYANQSHRIQQYVNNFVDTSYVPNVLPFLFSASAANSYINLQSQDFIVGGGKKRTTQLNFFGPLCDVEGSCGQSLCATGDTIEPKEETFTITQCTSTKKFSLRLEDLRSIDYNQWDYNYVARTIVETAMPAARGLLAEDMLTYLLSKVGVLPNGHATDTLKLLNTQTGSVNPMGWLKLKKHFVDAKLRSNPYSLGGGSEIFALTQLQGSAGMNDDGVNTGAVQVPNLWYDEGMIGQIKGDTDNGNYVLAIDPRMIKVVSFIENAGIFRTDLDSINDIGKLFTGAQGHDFILGTYTDPQTGIIWDLYINFEKCGTNNKPEWSFHLEHKWDIFVLPPNQCTIQGYNGVVLYRTCPETEQECPSGGVSPLSPASATTYSATPNLAEIPTISQSTIGGVSNSQETPVAISTITDLVNYMNANYSAAIFSVNGSNIEYDGHVAIGASFNSGDYTLTFS